VRYQLRLGEANNCDFPAVMSSVKQERTWLDGFQYFDVGAASTSLATEG
jgi:hypothetical protein